MTLVVRFGRIRILRIEKSLGTRICPLSNAKKWLVLKNVKTRKPVNTEIYGLLICFVLSLVELEVLEPCPNFITSWSLALKQCPLLSPLMVNTHFCLVYYPHVLLRHYEAFPPNQGKYSWLFLTYFAKKLLAQ